MKVIAHRGNGNIYKSNTKEALLQALKYAYVDGIEFDVRMTKDKKIVIIHDPIIDLVSDGSGIVRLMNLDEIENYNFGTKEHPSKICTLEELLKNIKYNKIIMIEIKEEIKDFKEKVDIIYNIIKKYSYLNIYIISFNYNVLKYMKEKYNVKCGLLIAIFINNDKLINMFDFNIIEYCYHDKIDKSKETFIFGLIKGDINKYNILTDKPYLFKNK